MDWIPSWTRGRREFMLRASRCGRFWVKAYQDRGRNGRAKLYVVVFLRGRGPWLPTLFGALSLACASWSCLVLSFLGVRSVRGVVAQTNEKGPDGVVWRRGDDACV